MLLCFLKRVITIPNYFSGAVVGVNIQRYQFRNSVLNLRASQGTMSARAGIQDSHYKIWAQSNEPSLQIYKTKLCRLLRTFTKGGNGTA